MNGGVNAYVLDAATGREVWSFDVIPDTGAPRATWPSGPNAPPPTGGGMWTSFTLDPASGILYVPAGNPAPRTMFSTRSSELTATTSSNVYPLNASAKGSSNAPRVQ